MLRKIKFVGHIFRGKDQITIDTLEKERRRNGRWWKQYADNLDVLGISHEQITSMCMNKSQWTPLVDHINSRLFSIAFG